MTSWNLKKYEDTAQKIGEDFVTSKGAESINDLSMRVSKEAQFNPDEIRTVVRLANVSAFEKIFSKSASDGDKDRMIEFEVGDPEVVINGLHSEAKESAATVKVASDYDQTLDYNRTIRYDKEPLEKTATVIPGVEMSTSPEKLPSRAEVHNLFKRAEQRMQEEKAVAEAHWFSTMEKAARSLISLDGRTEARTAFEKNAASYLGESVIPELKMMYCLTSPKGAIPVLFEGEKVASVLNHHIAVVSGEQKPIIDMVKHAQEVRNDVTRMTAGLKWLEENTPKVK